MPVNFVVDKEARTVAIPAPYTLMDPVHRAQIRDLRDHQIVICVESRQVLLPDGWEPQP